MATCNLSAIVIFLVVETFIESGYAYISSSVGPGLNARVQTHRSQTVANQDWHAQQYDAGMASMCSQLEHRKINICNICMAAARHPCIVVIQMQDSIKSVV